MGSKVVSGDGRVEAEAARVDVGQLDRLLANGPGRCRPVRHRALTVKVARGLVEGPLARIGVVDRVCDAECRLESPRGRGRGERCVVVSLRAVRVESAVLPRVEDDTLVAVPSAVVRLDAVADRPGDERLLVWPLGLRVDSAG